MNPNRIRLLFAGLAVAVAGLASGCGESAAAPKPRAGGAATLDVSPKGKGGGAVALTAATHAE